MRSTRSLNSRPPSPALLLGLVGQGPKSRSPLATDCSGLPSNSVRLATPIVDAVVEQQQLDAFLRKISRCGLFFAGEAVGGDEQNAVCLPSSAHVVGEARGLAVAAVLAKRSSFAMRSRYRRVSATPSLKTLPTRSRSGRLLFWFSANPRPCQDPLHEADRIARPLEDLPRDR